jgi:predicted ATPase
VHDIGVAAASQWAIGAWHQGLIGIADFAYQEAFAIAARLNHHTTTGYALYYNGVLAAFFRRDFAALAEHAARLREHGLRYDLPQWTALASALEGAARAHAGKVDEGILAIEHGLLLCDRIKNQSMQPVFLAGLAESQLMAGRYLDVASTLDKAFSCAQGTGELWMNAELWRLRAALASAKGAEQAAGKIDAEHCLKCGRDVAERQESKIFTLRLATSLARLWREQGKRTEARDLLAPIYGWFTEGFDTPDLKEAKALLDLPK